MNLYIAGSSQELDRVANAIALAESHGIQVTLDWVSIVRRVGLANPPDATKAECMEWSLQDLHGVKTADVLWLLAPEVGAGWGAGVEFGVALERGIPIVVSGVNYKASIFTSLANDRYESDDTGFRAVLTRLHSMYSTRASV